MMHLRYATVFVTKRRSWQTIVLETQNLWSRAIDCLVPQAYHFKKKLETTTALKLFDFFRAFVEKFGKGLSACD